MRPNITVGDMSPEEAQQALARFDPVFAELHKLLDTGNVTVGESINASVSIVLTLLATLRKSFSHDPKAPDLVQLAEFTCHHLMRGAVAAQAQSAVLSGQATVQ